ncbi:MULTISPECIES: glycoside hydrolase family 3 N-terminal domain-containing protein [unclassified Variovorax]|uniref:glycoside hydrolase family 3 N-terminal domain-containing protein n=1 Tax=unclassified Variovorax TaxID=663243 RepID=UPI00076CA779|nr:MULTISPECIES: glycoside hydrolase family 3 N-terminal domain-containing protein [unclassified Variovorax]KWT83607.1 Beta-glucosidase [Variovorax sp. WDL1]PNG52054.1 Periplasmic beta-glucosidase [Variovorax sp. B4]PNG54594.1 Periplasmic beta-glucosidase [Variovorax sp. B2]VTV15571.1 Periplasmic beta-glucosidase precursor [Variovorax sp. WDL1]
MSRIDTLMARMTLSEKLGQLTMTASSYTVTGPVLAGDSTQSIIDGTVGNLLNMVGAGPVHEMQRLAVEKSRLGIPLLIGLDIIHGHRTLFPIPPAEAGIFDEALWERTAREAAREGTADGLAMTFAPMLDVSRDPRWGRTAEGPGEDPWLNTRIAQAKVRGFQGADLSSAESLAACAKHFVAYGAVTAGREYAAVDISERTLHEVHLPGFAAAVRAGVATLMPAFTDLNGVPMTAHVPLLRDWLRGEMGFDGVIVSDYNAIGELIKHGVAADLADAAVLALKAGVDIDMMADAYRKGLPIALEEGRVTIQEIDACVRRVLRLKEQLGLFDDPYRRGATPEPAAAIAERHALAREVAGKAIVMLKNERDTLPLPAGAKALCVIGPLADASTEMKGPWWGAGEHEPAISVLAGLRAALPQTDIRHAPGVAIEDADDSGIEAAVALCDGADAVLLCLGERAPMSGEAASRATPALPGRQQALAEAVTARARALGIPVIAILFSGRPLVVPWLSEHVDALLAAWFLGVEAGHAIADVVTGRVSPSGRTTMSWPRAIGQVPIYFGQRPSGRPMNPADYYTSKYQDVENTPLYDFGHGLTYGRFTYDELQVEPRRVREQDRLAISVSLRNAGPREAEETVFLFVHHKLSRVTRPLLELKGYAKLRLMPGGAGSVKLELPAAELRCLGPDLQPGFEAGEVEILVGPSADPTGLLRQTVELY